MNSTQLHEKLDEHRSQPSDAAYLLAAGHFLSSWPKHWTAAEIIEGLLSASEEILVWQNILAWAGEENPEYPNEVVLQLIEDLASDMETFANFQKGQKENQLQRRAHPED
jgi:hypothetical protein